MKEKLRAHPPMLPRVSCHKSSKASHWVGSSPAPHVQPLEPPIAVQVSWTSHGRGQFQILPRFPPIKQSVKLPKLKRSQKLSGMLQLNLLSNRCRPPPFDPNFVSLLKLGMQPVRSLFCRYLWLVHKSNHKASMRMREAISRIQKD